MRVNTLLFQAHQHRGGKYIEIGGRNGTLDVPAHDGLAIFRSKGQDPIVAAGLKYRVPRRPELRHRVRDGLALGAQLRLLRVRHGYFLSGAAGGVITG